MSTTTVTAFDDFISIRIPITLKRYRGQTVLVLPEGEHQPTAVTAKPNIPLIKALSKAYLWQKALDTQEFTSIDTLAKHKRVNPSYVSRILRLNLLSPQIKKAILDGTGPPELSLQALLLPFPSLWEEQLTHFGFAN